MPKYHCRRGRPLGLGLALLVGLTACAVGSSGQVSTGSVDPSLARVRSAGQVTICSSDDQPYAYRDQAQGGQLVGTDVDIMRLVAARLHAGRLDMFQVPFSGIIPALLSRRCDVIADNVTITLKRAQVVSFSFPIYSASNVLIVPRGNPARIQSEAGLAGHAVGTYAGTVTATHLQDLASKDATIHVKLYKDIPEVLAEMAAGRLDAAEIDGMVVAYILRSDPDQPWERTNAPLPNLSKTSIGLAFRKEDVSLRQAVDDANRDIQTSGDLTRVFQKWNLVPYDSYYPWPGCCA